MSIRISTLPNGLRIATDSMADAASVSLGVFIARGTRHEKPGTDGVAHLLEHMMFKGTKSRSARQIAEEIENVGGYLDAWTGREQTAYTAKVLSEHTPLAIHLLGDMLRESVFDPEELARERDVVLQEIAEAEDDPSDIVFDYLQEVAFPHQGLGRPVLGRAEIVATLDSSSLREHLAHHYQASSMVITAAGKINHDFFLGHVAEAFAQWPAETIDPAPLAVYSGGISLRDRKLEQAHLTLAFAGPHLRDESRHAAGLYALLLGGGMSSRLFQEVREKRGLAYSVHSFLWPYTDTGLFGLYVGAAPKRAKEAVDVALDCLRVSVGSVTTDELDRAKAQAKASILMGRESTMQRCEALAQQLLIWDRNFSLEEQVAALEAVNLDHLHHVGEKIFSTSPTFVAMGSAAKFSSIKDLFAS